MKHQLLASLILSLIAPVVLPIGLMVKAETVAPMLVVEQKISIANEAKAEELALADNYAKAGNFKNAIAILTSLINEGIKTPKVFYKLAEFSLQDGRNPQIAETAYQQSIEVAIKAKDFKVQADSQVALARVKMMLGKPDEAKILLRQAKLAYQSLGEVKRATELEAEITAITNNTNNSGNFSRPIYRDNPAQYSQEWLCEVAGVCSDGN